MSLSVEPPMTSISSSILREVTPQDLFNLPLYEHHLVIDTRPQSEYADGHIATAVSLPSPDVDCSEAEREKLLVQFIKSYIKEYVRPENPSPIVLYGSKQTGCVRHMEWLARKLEKLQKDRKAVARVDHEIEYSEPDEQIDPFEYFCYTIADRVREIWILEGGYEMFCSEYGFLCGDVPFESMFPLPHQINFNLFLGSRVFPLKKECLSKLGVTHMIVSTYQNIDWQELEGISVLRCDVHDKNNQDMIPCWKACVTFMTEALSPSKEELETRELVANVDRLQVKEEGNGRDKDIAVPPARILVILHGRSRSTSVVLAYLIKTLKIGFEEAWSFVRMNCWHLIDRSLVYEDQLKEWEKTETRSIEHV